MTEQLTISVPIMAITPIEISWSKTSGFTMIELMIVVAIVGLLSATAVPWYRGYINTAWVSKVSNTYDSAVKTARQEYTKNTTRSALGLSSTLPSNEEGWIEVFTAGDEYLAPDGGPAYRPGHQPDASEDPPSGAVYVAYHSDHLCITRNEFLGLIALKTKVYSDSIETINL